MDPLSSCQFQSTQPPFRIGVTGPKLLTFAGRHVRIAPNVTANYAAQQPGWLSFAAKLLFTELSLERIFRRRKNFALLLCFRNTP